MFVDDCLVLSSVGQSKANLIKESLAKFHKALGQMSNLEKS